jgi:DNA polymerase-1
MIWKVLREREINMDLLKKLKEFNELKSNQEIIEGVNGKVLLVDALNTYIRCFVATPTMNDDGDHVGGVSGFLKSVGLAIRQFNPTRVVLVFDGKGGSSGRRKMFGDYKDSRKPMQRLNRTYDFKNVEEEKEAMKWQLKLLIELCENLPVTVIAIDNIEADDTIAYLTQTVTESNGKSIIMSTDKDFLQLVSNSCSVYNPIKKKIYAVSDVLSEYGVHPNNFIIYRMLDGDKSDNIPGIKGIGLKTLKKNLPFVAESNSHTISELFDYCKSQNKPFHQKILDNKDILDRNFQLMSLVELPISGMIKMNITEQFNSPISKLNKPSLTKLFIEHKLFNSFGNYDEWMMRTWLPLNRYSGIKG